ncbi:hypothetical protein SAMN04487910_4492 [Aquimarina amphilecti]|uniref:Uncharacterized protein n=1 Tax=Aquimarina amphilecti TaxID=1038014 RepID=A0A1H7WQH4_AQUAM|nr:hypothetical protein [Aquimarina amphilecti]SEM23207.1 hypothetical protein SAMN04487910_4492 [Aquimarina amphilecti]
MAKKVQKPQKCITENEARELHDNWCKKRSKRLQKKLGFEDKREFHWSVAELEEYLAYVKQESEKQGIKDPGIRVYLGAYSESKCKMKKGYSTLFFAPTGSRPGAFGKDGEDPENNYGIEPFNHSSGGHPPNSY